MHHSTAPTHPVQIMYSRDYLPVWGGISRMTENRWEKAGKIPKARLINGKRARPASEVYEVAEMLLNGSEA